MTKLAENLKRRVDICAVAALEGGVYGSLAHATEDWSDLAYGAGSQALYLTLATFGNSYLYEGIRTGLRYCSQIMRSTRSAVMLISATLLGAAHVVPNYYFNAELGVANPVASTAWYMATFVPFYAYFEYQREVKVWVKERVKNIISSLSNP